MKKMMAILLCCLISISSLFSVNPRINGCDLVIVEGKEAFRYEGDSLMWELYGGSVLGVFTVEEAGMYNIAIGFTTGRGRSDEIQLEYTLDGQPLSQSAISLDRVYDYGALRVDSAGNSLRSLTEVSTEQRVEKLRKKDGSSATYLAVYFDAGIHELLIQGIRTDFSLDYIEFIPVSSLRTYDNHNDNSSNQLIHIEAEDIYQSSSSMLAAQYDRSDASVSPSDPSRLLLNIAGGDNWNTDGQWIRWKFIVPESGWYGVRIKFRQSKKSGVSVYRRLLLDDAITYVDWDCLAFTYGNNWQLHTASDIKVYLEAGQHTLSLEVVPGPYAGVLSELLGVVDTLNSIYRRIIMITGTSPDPNREYNVDREIDGLITLLADNREALLSIESELRVLSGLDNITYIPIRTLITQLESFLSHPESIPSRISVFKSNISSLSSWVYSAQEQPLDLDWIELVSGDAQPKPVKASLFRNLGYSALSLIYSFFPREVEEQTELTIWLSSGRDQLQIVKDLIDERFTPETGIKIKLNLVQTGIEQAILAGAGPDMVLFMGNTVPVTLAMRDALLPLDSFEDFYPHVDSFCTREALVPYIFEGHVYGMPLTQLFPMLFYRTDIFDELNLSVPTTWDTLKQIIPVIQRKNMEVGIPSSYTTFVTLLMQQGGTLYSSDKRRSELHSEEANTAFSQYTRLFSDYSLPLSYDFFNRFRSGEMPLALVDYTEYGKLAFAAPELMNLWEMAPIPASSGNAQTAVTSGQGAVILKDCTNVEAAWEFLKWFCSVPIQTEYGRRLEGLLGPAGRYPSASDDVIARLPWLPEEAHRILEQKSNLREIEQVPGSYYLQRNITSAFRNVVLEGGNPREMLDRYASIIDRELIRKRQELGLEVAL